MVEVVKSNKSLNTLPAIENEAFWNSHIESFKKSGLTRIKYCRLNKINYDRFGYWIRKSSPRKSPLIAVRAKSNNELSLPTSPLCILNLPNGRHLSIHDFQALSFIIEKVV
jgi:hypothetical protein